MRTEQFNVNITTINHSGCCPSA